jgi:protocatechuate 3,4-dioxygenase alpha subunit
MSTETRPTPSGSQTVGPYFRIGLDYLLERAPEIANTEAAIEIRGRVIDRDGSPVPDALLEFWSSGGGRLLNSAIPDETGFPDGFRRAPTDDAGNFAVSMRHPAVIPTDERDTQAPHMLVLIFARGLLRHLISRVYFEGEPANESDPVLLAVPTERRRTLIARRDGPNKFHWDVALQGADETVFFAW